MSGDNDVMRTLVQHEGVLLVDTPEEPVDRTDMLIRCPSYRGGATVFTELGLLNYGGSRSIPRPALLI